MKKAYLVLLILTGYHFASAQQAQQTAQPAQAAQTPQTDPEAPYKKFPTIPPFHLLKVDSATYLTKDDIKKHRRTMVMFFSPDCDHCKRQTDSILAAMDKFKDIEIVMATYQPFSEMKEFNEHYHLADHPNIHIGRDEKFFLVPYYRIHNLPYLALYDKNGDLITTYEGTQKTSTLLNAFAQKKAEE
ncbi:MAG TPA: thioredoxin fold domain-containing protein [Puia sp.]|nr:thioredoxin fold domain-containing protein [Puia sp.]